MLPVALRNQGNFSVQGIGDLDLRSNALLRYPSLPTFLILSFLVARSHNERPTERGRS